MNPVAETLVMFRTSFLGYKILVNVRNYLINQGLIAPHDMPNASGEYRIICPECKNDKQKCYVNGTGKGAFCMHCNLSLSWRGFCRLFDPPTMEEVVLETFVKEASEALWADSSVLNYLEGRRIAQDTLRRARIGLYKDLPLNFEGDFATKFIELGIDCLEDRLIIPYFRDGFISTVRGRSLSDEHHPKYMSLKHSENQYYSPWQIESEKVIACEGELDCLILLQSGYNAVGIPGAQNLKLIDQVKDLKKKIYICLDGDEAGRKATDKIIKHLPEVYNVDLPDEVDANEYINAFGEDSFGKLISNAKLYIEGKEQTSDDLASSLEAWTDWAWTNSELLGPKIKWAPRLESAISGWSNGLFLCGALPASGKTAFQIWSAYHAANDNKEDTMVHFLSLDDESSDTFTRLVALHSNISFELVRSPRWSFDNPNGNKRPELLKQYMNSIEYLKGMKNLIIRDSRYGRSLNYVRNYIKTARQHNPEKYLIFFIDSLAKLTADGEAEEARITNWKAYLATELKYLSTMYDCCIVTPADFRKINDFRRPTNDDLKDASELAYEANCVLLGFNELNIKNDEERTILKWHDKNGGTWPILEMNLSKNKKTLFRGNIRFKFFPATSSFKELTMDEEKGFNQLIEEAQQKKEAFSSNGFAATGKFETRLATRAFDRT